MGAILRVRDKDGNVYDIPAIRGARGPQGPKGDPGSGLKVLDYYDTLDALEAAVTAPSAGDAYGVGTAAPYDIYIYGETSGWVNNGTIQGAQGQEGPAGTDGHDGITPTIGDNGNWYLGGTDTGKPSRGETGPSGPQGETGQTGASGYTPVRGTDYWTSADQQAIVDAVLAALPAAEGVSV